MDNFISVNFDYVDYIKSEEDMKLFNRLKELEKELHKPIKECIEAFKEYTQIDRKLRGLKEVKFVTLNNPKLN